VLPKKRAKTGIPVRLFKNINKNPLIMER
jgi:hypothetical protein